MKSFLNKPWTSRIVPILIVLGLMACGGKKDGGATNAEVNLDNIPKVSTADSGGSSLLDSKDSGSGNANDLCDRQGDAYERFAGYTLNSRDYVYKVAKDSSFDALYTAHTSNVTYTAADLAVMHSYFAQADMRVYGMLNVSIEKQLGRFQAAMAKGEYTAVQSRYSELLTMLEARRTLFAFYANIFGMTGYTWAEARDKDLDGDLAAVMKDYREKIAAESSLTATQKAELDEGLKITAQLSTMRVAEKDFAIHAVYQEAYVVKVELAPVTMATANYVAYREYTAADFATMEQQVVAYKEKLAAVDVAYAELAKQKETMDAATFATKTATLKQQYVEYTAAKDLTTKFMKENGRVLIEATRENTATLATNRDTAAIEKRMEEIRAELAKADIPAERASQLKAEYDKLSAELASAKGGSDGASWSAPARVDVKYNSDNVTKDTSKETTKDTSKDTDKD